MVSSRGLENRKDELDYNREDKESQLPERKKNLILTPSDDRQRGSTAREVEESR
jgi:hypothetical protein